MIDSSLSCSSSWDMDPFQDSSEISFKDFDSFLSLDRNFSQFESLSAFNESSNTSSDYDSIYFGDLEDSSIADSFLSEMLQDNSIMGFPEDWSLLHDSDSHILPVESTSYVRDCPRTGNTSDHLSEKSWSKMSTEEKLETLHSLSKIVTSHLNIQEQIKVIKIIDPSVTISPNDTEFSIDISRLSDAKLKRIQGLVQKHKNSSTNPKKEKSSSKNISSKRQSLTSKMFSRRTNSKTKRRQKKEKICTNEDVCEDVRQKRKLELHGQKEVQSGLFVYEKVIKLSNPLEDEDVNILE